MQKERNNMPLITPPEDTPIRVENLNLYMQGHQILKDVCLSIPKRKITCIIGPSGCGKTTLLRSFNRLHDESLEVKVNGRVLIDGEDVYSEKACVIDIRRKMGLLAQRPCPLPMSIYDNVAYGPRLHRSYRKKELHAIVEKYLRAVVLWEEVKDRLQSSAGRLSMGQQQRLCLARGLAVEPDILLGDEATSALDPISSRMIEELFLELKKEYTIVLVTHTLRQARRIADYIAFMYQGSLIEFGSNTEFFENPQNRLTQDYISGSFS